MSKSLFLVKFNKTCSEFVIIDRRFFWYVFEMRQVLKDSEVDFEASQEFDSLMISALSKRLPEIRKENLTNYLGIRKKLFGHFFFNKNLKIKETVVEHFVFTFFYPRTINEMDTIQIPKFERKLANYEAVGEPELPERKKTRVDDRKRRHFQTGWHNEINFCRPSKSSNYRHYFASLNSVSEDKAYRLILNNVFFRVLFLRPFHQMCELKDRACQYEDFQEINVNKLENDIASFLLENKNGKTIVNKENFFGWFSDILIKSNDPCKVIFNRYLLDREADFKEYEEMLRKDCDRIKFEFGGKFIDNKQLWVDWQKEDFIRFARVILKGILPTVERKHYVFGSRNVLNWHKERIINFFETKFSKLLKRADVSV